MPKVSKKIIRYASSNPTQKTHSQSMEALCKEIEKDTIILPMYQTGLRWTKQKYVDLFEFMFTGKAPVSPISINIISDVHKAVEQVTFINRNIVSDLKGKSSVTDGQQRLTCLFKAYINDPDFEDIVFDVSKVKFYILKSKIKDYQIPVGVLLNKDIETYYNYMNSNSFMKSDEIKDAVLSVRKKFFGYNFIVNLAEDLNEEEQIKWFEVLNNAGTRLTRLQMKFAKMLVKGLDIYPDYIRPFVDRIYNLDLMDLFKTKQTETSYPISALNPVYETRQDVQTKRVCPTPSDTNEAQLATLEIDELRKIINITLFYLDETLNFIEKENLKKPERMEQITYLLGVLVHNGSPNLNNEQKQKLIEWYNTVEFKNVSTSGKRNI